MAIISDVTFAGNVPDHFSLCSHGWYCNRVQGIFFPQRFWSGEFVGLKYFKKFVDNPDFMRLMKNTLILSMYSLLVSFPAPIILALALNIVNNEKFKKFVQSLTYAPYFISTVVLVGIILQVFNLNSGIVNNVMNTLGLERVNFLGKASMFRHLYVWSGVWQTTGYGRKNHFHVCKRKRNTDQ